jgi:hypothetical protein
MPIRKVGNDTPANDTASNACAPHEFRRNPV